MNEVIKWLNDNQGVLTALQFLLPTGIIGSIIAIIIKNKSKRNNLLTLNKMDNQNPVNITSINQSGGITAQNVNINTGRILDDKLKEQLKEKVKNNKTVNITSILGDSESYVFATKIKEYLESLGIKVDGVNQAVYNKPVYGQSITPEGDKIIIGINQ